MTYLQYALVQKIVTMEQYDAHSQFCAKPSFMYKSFENDTYFECVTCRIRSDFVK